MAENVMTKGELQKTYGIVYGYHYDYGLAKARKGKLEFHVDADGKPAYDERYVYVDDFVEGLAVVSSSWGEMFHIRPDGKPAYQERYEMVSSFVHGLAYVMTKDGRLLFIRPDGQAVYEEVGNRVFRLGPDGKPVEGDKGFPTYGCWGSEVIALIRAKEKELAQGQTNKP